MTTAQDIVNQIAYARKEGREQGCRDTALAMLQDGMEASLIAKYTGLSIDDVISLTIPK